MFRLFGHKPNEVAPAAPPAPAPKESTREIADALDRATMRMVGERQRQIEDLRELVEQFPKLEKADRLVQALMRRLSLTNGGIGIGSEFRDTNRDDGIMASCNIVLVKSGFKLAWNSGTQRSKHWTEIDYSNLYPVTAEHLRKAGLESLTQVHKILIDYAKSIPRDELVHPPLPPVEIERRASVND